MAATRILAGCALALAPISAFGLDIRTANDQLEITLLENRNYYYGLQFSETLSDFETIELAIGSPAPVITYALPGPGESWFFQRETISVFAPRDSDGDGMHDVYELFRAHLDPLDPSDARLLSPDSPGLTNLEEYRARFDLGPDISPQLYSREVSLFNFGTAIERLGSISREYSVFNFGEDTMMTLGREFSVFNGERPAIAGYPQSYSREVSLFNFEAQTFTSEAVSREVTIFNGAMPANPDYPQTYSREVSVFNNRAPLHTVEVISREVSLLNNVPEI